MPLFDRHSELVDGKLVVDGMVFGAHSPLTVPLVESARKTRKLDEPAGETGSRRRRGETETWTVLTPTRVVELDPSVIQGKPWFRNEK